MKYKLVLSDYDETLVPKDKEMSEYTLNAIKRYVNLGGKFVIASGRATKALEIIMANLGLTGYIMAFNGSIVSDMQTGEILVDLCLENENAINVCKAFEEKGYMPQLYDGDDVLFPYPTEDSIAYERRTKVAITYTGMPSSEYLKKTGKTTPKILVYVDPEKVDRKEFTDYFQSKFNDTNDFLFTQAFLFECINKKAGKGNAAKALWEHLGLKKEEVLAFGDGMNDMQLLQTVGKGVAVGNSCEELKAIATEITLPCNEDGVAKYLEKIMEE
ncbi:MAG: HAD family phosphatase [Clostridia bacterium]|nr:HAD family phosphatase [Clostridia bacterium]MBR2874857.1 HAD family phosphatase [Clostridia bacterium]